MDLGNMKVTGRMLRTVLNRYSSILEKYSSDEYLLSNIMKAFGITIKDIKERVEKEVGKESLLSKESSIKSILSMYKESKDTEWEDPETLLGDYGHKSTTLVDTVKSDKNIKREDMPVYNSLIFS